MAAETDKTLTIAECFKELSYTYYDYLLLSSYCDHQTLYTRKGFVILTILKHILTKDPVITKRILKYIDIGTLFLDDYFKCIFQKLDVGEIILEEIINKILGKEISLDDYLSGDIIENDMDRIIDSLDERSMYPFRYIIDKTTNNQAYHLDDFDIFHIFMLLDAYFYAIDERLVKEKYSSITLIKEIISYRNKKLMCNYNHTRWLFDIISSNESFGELNRKNHSFLSDEYSFFQELLNLLSGNIAKDHFVEYLFILYEANKGSHFLDALYNNFHSLPSNSLNPYLFGRMYPSFCVNEKEKEIKPIIIGLLPRSYIQEYECPRIVNSWKDAIQSALFGKDKMTFERVEHLLSALNSLPSIRDFLFSSQFILSVISVNRQMERRNRIQEARAYYDFIATQGALKYRNEYSECVIDLNIVAKWKNDVNYDEYPYEENPFFVFVDNKSEQDSTEKKSTNCFLTFFTWKASEIEKALERVCHSEDIIQDRNKQIVLDKLSPKERAILSLYKADSDLPEMILSVFPCKHINKHYMIYKDAVKDDEIRVVNRFSPDDWEELFNKFCGISCGKKALAKSPNYPDLKFFAADCIGGKQYQCRKRFLKIIENNIPISRTNIKK